MFTSAESQQSADCITLFNDSVRILKHRNIDNKGHGHVIALEGLLEKVTIIANIFAPVRSLGREQQEFYEH